MGEELTMNDDLLSKCVIDTSKRTVYLYSDGGDKKTVNCDTVEEFMNVLNFVRDKVEEERVFYSDPL
jgi:imidazoleglycerol phosphate dehydratase HisB